MGDGCIQFLIYLRLLQWWLYMMTTMITETRGAMRDQEWDPLSWGQHGLGGEATFGGYSSRLARSDVVQYYSTRSGM